MLEISNLKKNTKNDVQNLEKKEVVCRSKRVMLEGM